MSKESPATHDEAAFIDLDNYELCRFPETGEWSLRLKLADGDVAHTKYLRGYEVKLAELALKGLLVSEKQEPNEDTLSELQFGLALLANEDGANISKPEWLTSVKKWAHDMQVALDERTPTETAHMIADNATEWQKHQAFEWLRNISLGDTEVARIAGVALDEWHKLKQRTPSAIVDSYAVALHADGTSTDLNRFLADAVLAYDAAIYSCSNDPEKMSSYCSAQGDDLDTLYDNMIAAARTIIPEEPQRG